MRKFPNYLQLAVLVLLVLKNLFYSDFFASFDAIGLINDAKSA